MRKITKKPNSGKIFLVAKILKNNQIWCAGRPIGWYDTHKRFIYEEKKITKKRKTKK